MKAQSLPVVLLGVLLAAASAQVVSQTTKNGSNSASFPKVQETASNVVTSQGRDRRMAAPLKPASSEKPSPDRLTEFASNTLFMLLGAAISFYATIVYERYKKFREILREVAEARVHFEGYPMSPNDLERAHDKSFDCWRLLESNQWQLNAQGQHEAAAQVGRLSSFAYKVTACIERMMSDQRKGNPIGAYLTAFQFEFDRIKSGEFIRFEEKIKPKMWVLLCPYPQPLLAKASKVILVDYFDKMP